MNRTLFHRPSALVFDYGGTLDTEGLHWEKLLWRLWQHRFPALQEYRFRQAYIFAEQALAAYPYIRPHFDFHELLAIKVSLQFDFLKQEKQIHVAPADRVVKQIADAGYDYARKTTQRASRLLEALQRNYRLALVSNFYGNLSVVLHEFGLDRYFPVVIESSTVGVSKPDPAIYRIALDRLTIPAAEATVIGDSYSNDMIPALALGCGTLWMKGIGWDEREREFPDEQIVFGFVNLRNRLC